MESQLLKITDKQRLFAEKFISLKFNGMRAAQEAGYSPKNAHISAHALLNTPKVKQYIDIRKQEVLNEVGVNTFQVLKELAAIAFADVRDFYDENGALKNVNKLDENAAKALMCVDVFEAFDQDGTKIGQTQRTRFHDKLKALELLGRYLNLFEKDNKSQAAEINIFEVTLDLK